MIIGFVKALLNYDITFMAISIILINVKLLKRKNSKDFLIARFIVGIALIVLEVELMILNISQGESYYENFMWACICLLLAVSYGIILRNNNQQNKK